MDVVPRAPSTYASVLGAFLVHDVFDDAWPADHLGRGCDGIFPHTVPCDHLLATFAMKAALSVLAVGGNLPRAATSWNIGAISRARA